MTQPKDSTTGERELTVDQIDEAITLLVVNGPCGAEAGVSLARIAGRALKMLQAVVGSQAAIVTADTLAKKLREGAI